MKSDNFKVDNFNVAHKDGYYLVSENKTSEKGKVYESEAKTYPSQLGAQDYLKANGVDNNDAAACLLDALLDYQQKYNQAHIKQIEKAKEAKLKKESK